MRLCLAVMFQNEANWLRLHLPVFAHAFDGLVGLDGGSTDDSAAVFRSFGGTVHHRAFDFNFGAQGNALLDAAIADGYDAVLRIDPDECIYPQTAQAVKDTLKHRPVVALPRINFAHNRLWFVPEWYPDHQFRGIRLDAGLRYAGKVHEGLDCDYATQVARLPTPAIYHYSGVRGLTASQKRSAVYGAIARNEQTDWSAPADEQWHYPPMKRFDGVQPLDPYAVGIHAPYNHAPNLIITPNLAGDRQIEYAWCERWISRLNGETLLDFGWGGMTPNITAALQRGYTVTALDIEPYSPIDGVKTLCGDVLTITLPTVDIIVNCSSIEHVGLAGRYSITKGDEQGDIKAMARLRDALNSGGHMIMTLPIGTGHTHNPMHRVYGRERFDCLTEGFDITESAGYRKDGNAWRECRLSEAFDVPSISVSQTDWRGSSYALGCFVLRKAS